MPTHFDGTDEQTRALNAFIKIFRASASVSARINAHLDDYDLTSSQFGVLESLYHLGTLYQAQIAEKILKTSGNVTHVIDNLEMRGLVKRHRNGDDRRYITIHLTPAGREMVERILPLHVGGVVAAFSCLTPDEQIELARLCKKVGTGSD